MSKSITLICAFFVPVVGGCSSSSVSEDDAAVGGSQHGGRTGSASGGSATGGSGGTSGAAGTGSASGGNATGGSGGTSGAAGTAGTAGTTPLPEGTELVAARITNPEALAVQGSKVFFTDCAGSVASVPVGGGEPTVLASDQSCPVPIAVDDEAAYWITGSGVLNKVPLGGGEVVQLAEGADFSRGLVIAGSAAFFGGDDSIMKVSTQGGEPVAVTTTTCRVLAADDTNLFFSANLLNTSGMMSGGVMSVSLEGGEPAVLAEGYAEAPTSIAVANDRVYYVAREQLATGIYSVAVEGGDATLLASNQFASIAVDERAIYWVDQNLWKLPLDGGTPTPLVSTVMNGDGTIALDSTHVYFGRQGSISGGAVQSDGSILSAAK